MSTRKNTQTLPKVIVRSFADEPVELLAHAIDRQADRVFVGILNAKSPLSLPVEDVFDYDQHYFTLLVKAFEENNKTRLAELYAELRDKRPCNRYQDALISVHEKEPEIANT